MNESELYDRVIKVELAKPNKGLAALDPTLPGIFLLRYLISMIVWQQEEWIKANVNIGDREGDNQDAMQGLEKTMKSG